MLNDPFELTVGVALNIGGCKGWNGRRNVRGKRNSCILAVAAMAYYAIVAEDSLAGFDVLGCWVKRILLALPAYGYMVLDPLQCRRFGPSRLLNFACRKNQAGNTA